MMLTKLLQRLPHFKGKFRLIRFFLSSYFKQTKDLEFAGKFGIKYKVPNASEAIGFELFVNGIYELEYIQLIIKHIPLNGVLLDLGANIGSIAIPIAKLRPDIQIFAVEASPRVFAYLKHNVEKNDCPNIFLENKALSTQDHQTVSFYSPTELFGKGSLNPVFTQVAELVETITVDTLVTKNHLPKVDFIKIDVEGFESTVLSGGRNLLAKPEAPAILFEFSSEMESQVEDAQAGDCQTLLRNLGYELSDVTNPKAAVPMPVTTKEGFGMILAQKNKVK